MDRFWRLVEAFSKMQKIRNGESVEPSKVVPVNSGRLIGLMGNAGRERSFDNLPLHIQDWAMKNGWPKPRCNGGK